MVTVTIVGGMIPICLGIYVWGTLHLFFAPLFLISLGVCIISLSHPSKITLVLLVASVILFVISHFAEPLWLEKLLEHI